MRVKKSIRGASVSLILNIITLMVGLISQAIFIKTLGIEYLGINGLFNNIISMLAIVELGIGPAIVYKLYKPLAEKDIESIKALMLFYKKCYNKIAIIVLVIGFIMLPFIKIIVNADIDNNIYFIFMLFIFDASASYIYSYKRSIIQADQNNYIISLVHIGYVITLNLIQILILIYTHNYIIYIIVKIIFRILENLVLSKISDILYPYLKDKNIKNISEDILLDIKKKVKGLIYHKIGGFMVSGTDNIIISKYLGVAYVGLYSNYYMIINAVYILISQIFSAFTASVGNLIVSETREYSYKIYKKIMLLNFWIYSIATSMIYTLIKPFIKLWIGEQFVLPDIVLVMLCINFYMLGMRASIGIYKDASGIFWEDRYIPIIESTINIVASIILVKKIGLVGIFIGTFLSSIIVVFFSLPYYVYRDVFKKNILEYYKVYIKYLLLVLISVLAISIITININFDNEILSFIFNMVISFFIPMIVNIITLNKTDEFIYFKMIVINILKNIKKFEFFNNNKIYNKNR
ncbi:lipopolysaccharide biosynthesis protein [Clostridium thermobutyricum]|uniref:Polysaccharide biosynthesis protein n=1 Tax=Clostridium thermobutyricum DSM 4928 TaxID=1121339 RepID=A0A1V4SU84_9CLOT|nr:hypothetical protein [Clostridium thermobutyricum]OPX47429.1 hypothetical protein CLTHE_19920 [Clostridium thermobutyricum DSM 4928]